MDNIVHKPWEREKSIETWNNLRIRVLRVNDNGKTSLQYHNNKFEIIFHNNGSYHFIFPNTIHHLGDDKEVLEISFGSDQNIVRPDDAQSQRTPIVGTSGGFDPIHIGHLRLLQECKQLGRVQVWLCDDDWLLRKKGYYFMPYDERKEILEALPYVDEVIPQINIESDTAIESLKKYKPDIFAKGGDRTIDNIPYDEKNICEKLGIKIVTNIGGGKVQSSSWLIKKVRGIEIAAYD